MFSQLVANGLINGSILAIAAAGVSMIYGILRLVNFAYGDFIAFGALMAYWFQGPLHLSMILATVFAMIATAALSLGLDVVLWRPLRARRAGFMSLFLASIGLALILRQTLLLVAGPQPRFYNVNPYKVVAFGSVRLAQEQVVAAAVAGVAIVVVGLFLARTTAGRVMRAMADDQALAAVAGVNVVGVIRLTWIVSGLLAGLAGVLAGLVEYSFDPNFGFQLLLPIFAAVVLGGIGSVFGALVAGFVLGVAMELSTWSGFAGGVNPTYKPVVAFVLLVLVLLVRPRGFFGKGVTT
jgi:branched-subunit amino acid ABC-type transport system permease component